MALLRASFAAHHSDIVICRASNQTLNPVLKQLRAGHKVIEHVSAIVIELIAFRSSTQFTSQVNVLDSLNR